MTTTASRRTSSGTPDAVSSVLASLSSPLMAALRDRYESKVDRSGGPDACHPWIAGRNKPGGYGHIRLSRTVLALAHRVGWQLIHGPIPAEQLVLHTCDNPPCQNPRHWFLGTQADNVADMEAKGRGRKARGRANGHGRLTDADVAVIRQRAESERSADIAVSYGITRGYVRDLVRGAAR